MAEGFLGVQGLVFAFALAVVVLLPVILLPSEAAAKTTAAASSTSVAAAEEPDGERAHAKGQGRRGEGRDGERGERRRRGRRRTRRRWRRRLHHSPLFLHFLLAPRLFLLAALPGISFIVAGSIGGRRNTFVACFLDRSNGNIIVIVFCFFFFFRRRRRHCDRRHRDHCRRRRLPSPARGKRVLWQRHIEKKRGALLR